jgi:hypothetical protein
MASRTGTITRLSDYTLGTAPVFTSYCFGRKKYFGELSFILPSSLSHSEKNRIGLGPLSSLPILLWMDIGARDMELTLPNAFSNDLQWKR